MLNRSLIFLTEVFFFKFTSKTDPDTRFVGTLNDRDFILSLILGITNSAALTADEINWKKYNVDILIDASGILENVKIISKKKNICDYSIITHANYNQPKIKTLIFGINDENFNFKKHKIISSSICDTVAFSPIYKLINDHFQIINGRLTTLHPWLPFQNLLDGKSASWSVPGDTFSQYALGRSAVQNLIPKSTSAVNAVQFKMASNNIDSGVIKLYGIS